MSDLSGRTTVVVGASRGLGRGIARAFAEAGAPVVAVARTGPALAELATTSANIRTEVADAADATVAWSLLDQYEPEVLILVAGANPVMRPLQYQTWETFSVNWHTDVKIAFTWLREALLKPLPPGSRVVVVSSGAAINGSPASGGYAGSKATQRFIAEYAQDESRRAGLDITVTAVMPRMTPFGDVGRRGVRAYAARGGQTEEAYLKQLGELLTPEMAGSALVDLVRANPATTAPNTCSPPPGCRSCHEHRRGTGCPSIPRSRPHSPCDVCPAGASVCLSDVQPRLGISAGRDK
jgi:NAD(P)-dependent dehydrogenase (short-subunit alcohol dehydrogenase family)